MASKIGENLFLQVLKPSRYIGGEINSIRKTWDKGKLKFALAFPEPYEIGMSHLGYQILYGILNKHEDIICERVFHPWHDMQSLLRAKDIPLFSLESREPLLNFNIIGFSLQYEMSYTNILSMLRLARIPVRSADRSKDHPLILGGGPCAFNPEPLADFFDAFIIGEAEEAILDFTKTFSEFKSSPISRSGLLEKLALVEGTYVPSLYKAEKDESTGIVYPIALSAGHKNVKRRVVEKLDIKHLPDKPIVPYMKVVHDRIAIEIQRGCTKGCRFCQAGMIYRPTRQRSASDITDYAINSQELTGQEDVSFLSLNSPDHPGLEKIFASLSRRYSGSGVSISLPSTRLDKFNEGVMRQMSSMRKTGFTFAPEAGSERLRKAINKNISDDEILGNLTTIFKAGWNLVKLYFMIGLPGETRSDIEAIIELVRKIRLSAVKISRRNRINVNISPFVPKPHTPYQWLGQENLSSLNEKLKLIMGGLKEKGINLKWHDPQTSAIEALLARGDRRLCPVLENLPEKGGFDGWSDHFRFEDWTGTLKNQGMELDKLINTCIPPDGHLPWDFIDTGINKGFLISELNNTETGLLLGDCAFEECNQCGLCHDSLQPIVDKAVSAIKDTKSRNISNNDDDFKPLLLTFSKTGIARFLSHLETIKVFERALRRTGIALKLSKGFHPIPLMRFSKALPLGVESEGEILLIFIDQAVESEKAMKRINSQLPEGFQILTARVIAQSLTRSSFKNDRSVYGYQIITPASLAKLMPGLIEDFKQKTSFIVEKKTKTGTREIDLKKVVLSIELQGSSVLITFDESGSQVNPLFALSRIANQDLKLGENVTIRKKR